MATKTTSSKSGAKKKSSRKTFSAKNQSSTRTRSTARKSTPAKKKSTRKYSPSSQKNVEAEMHEFKQGKLKSGSGRKVTSRKQAIAIGLSEARREGKKVPRKKS